MIGDFEPVTTPESSYPLLALGVPFTISLLDDVDAMVEYVLNSD